MTTTAQPLSRPIEVTLWRDYDDNVCLLPQMRMGTTTVRSATADARRFYNQGARRVSLAKSVALTDADDEAEVVHTLILVRELTSYGIAVDWRLHLGTDVQSWRLLSHLYPPSDVYADSPTDSASREWRSLYHFCKCVYRLGPGFVQVRDRRASDLRRITIDAPDHRSAIESLLTGAPAAAVPPQIISAFATAGLIKRVGELALWLPYRERRRPISLITL